MPASFSFPEDQTRAEKEGPDKETTPEPLPPVPGLEQSLTLATLAIALIALVLLAGLWVVRTGSSQLRGPAPVTSLVEGKPAQPSASDRVTSSSPRPESEPTALLGLEVDHRLPSGVLSLHVDGRLLYETRLERRQRRAFFFRLTAGSLRLSLPVKPGLRRITLRLRSDELGLDVAAETAAQFSENDWRLLEARLRPEDNSLEIRWR